MSNELLKSIKIKRYPDQLQITDQYDNTHVISDIGHQAGEYTKEEWLDNPVVELFDHESIDDIFFNLRNSTNIEFFAEVDN